MSSRATTPAGRGRAATRGRVAGRASHAPARPAASQRAAPERQAPGRTTARRPAPARGLRRRARLILIAVAVVALGAGYFGWFRDSSLVAVTDVSVEGVSSADRGQITSALTDAAEDMTTLHVREDELAAAASRFPTVASLSADASFPHGLTITVTERKPVAIAEQGDRKVPVAADGTLLPGLPTSDLHLATLDVASLPASGRLSGDALAEAQVVGAAPDPLVPLIASVAINSQYGVTLTMRGGFALRFGGPRRLAAKWAAAAAVLADPTLTTLSYVDVRIPERPAVGGAGEPTGVATTIPPPPAATNPAASATDTTTAPTATTTSSIAP